MVPRGISRGKLDRIAQGNHLSKFNIGLLTTLIVLTPQVKYHLLQRRILMVVLFIRHFKRLKLVSLACVCAKNSLSLPIDCLSNHHGLSDLIIQQAISSCLVQLPVIPLCSDEVQYILSGFLALWCISCNFILLNQKSSHPPILKLIQSILLLEFKLIGPRSNDFIKLLLAEVNPVGLLPQHLHPGLHDLLVPLPSLRANNKLAAVELANILSAWSRLYYLMVLSGECAAPAAPLTDEAVVEKTCDALGVFCDKPNYH